MSGDAERPWYERYFGDDYLRIYRFADTAEQLAILERFVAPLPDGARLLDLPCGQGRHAAVIGARGLDVVGLDLNRELLAAAADTAAANRARLALVRGDMRWFPFGDAGFDAAICMFTSLGYFDDDLDNQFVLNEFGRVTKRDAPFLLDLACLEWARDLEPTSAWVKDGVEVSSEYSWDEGAKRHTTKRRLVFEDGRERRLESSVRLFARDEIEAMLALAGFTVTETLGSYAGDPAGPDQRRLILISRRAA